MTDDQRYRIWNLHENYEMLSYGLGSMALIWWHKKDMADSEEESDYHDEMLLNKCAWKDTGDYWESSCGLHFTINDGTPADNGMIYCPRCGEKIE